MKGTYNKAPPRARYERMWDVNLVLVYLSSGDSSQLNVKEISHRVATLLAISLLLRVSELADISRESVRILPLEATFNLLSPRKTQHTGPLQTLSIRRQQEGECPVSWLEVYLSRTDHLLAIGSRLFVGLVKPHMSVGGSTLARWKKSCLAEAEVDMGVFTAHSSRGSSASGAVAGGIPVDTVLRRAN